MDQWRYKLWCARARARACVPEWTCVCVCVVSPFTRVVGVSMDALEKHEEFCTAKGLAFKLLSDGDGSVSASYGADLKIPILGKFSDRQTFLIDDKGTVVGHWLERDGSMANVKTPAHTEQILAAIDKA